MGRPGGRPFSIPEILRCEMTRVLVQFLTGYSRYNKGETAGFDETKAKQLCAGKAPVARMVGPVKEVTALTSEDIDLLENDRQELALAGDNLANQLASLDQRERDLEARGTALDGRAQHLAEGVAALLKCEQALEAEMKSFAEKGVSEENSEQAAADPAEQAKPAPVPKDKAPGAPPKQGAKA
jgi:chromosome segregation ATPase